MKRYIQKNNCIVAEFETGWAIVDVDAHNVTTVNEVGNFFWNHLKEANTVDKLIESVTAEYNVNPVCAKEDLEQFLNEMIKRELVQVV